MIRIYRRATERRANSRYRLDAPTLVRSEAAGIAAAMVLEASVSGLGVSLPFPLPVNSEIKLQIEGHTVSGFIRNCACVRAMEFHMGIEVPRRALAADDDFNHLYLLQKAKAMDTPCMVRSGRAYL